MEQMMVQRARQVQFLHKVVDVPGQVDEVGRGVEVVGGIGVEVEVVGRARIGKNVLHEVEILVGKKVEIQKPRQVG